MTTLIIRQKDIKRLGKELIKEILTFYMMSGYSLNLKKLKGCKKNS